MTTPDPLGIERLPILVGVVGNVSFDRGDDELNEQLLGIFQARFRSLVAYLDLHLPLTPKVLLCGGAAGVDQVAADTVLQADATGAPLYPAWSVVMMLPVDRVLFLEDFQGNDAAWQNFRALEQNPRVSVKTLQPLLRDGFDDIRLEPPGLARVAPHEISRAGPDRLPRRLQYEQLALWLARSATILVAAMPAKATAAMGDDVAPGQQEAKLGGTARAVAFRRAALPDAAAAEVLARSSDLLTNSPLEEPDGGYVLLIDPTANSDKGLPGLIRVLRPIQRVFDIREGREKPAGLRRQLYREPGQNPPDPPATRHATPSEHLRAALSVAMTLEQFHRRQLLLGPRFSVASLRMPAPFRNGLGRWAARKLRERQAAPEFADESPADFLVRMRRGALDQQQQGAHSWYLRLLWAMILILLAAVLCYEIFIEFQELHLSWLILYVILVGLAALIAWIVQWQKLQLRDEDLRGIKEMLRVQIAWWGAGISRNVDRIHLRSIDSDLRLLREIGAVIALWAQLRCRTFKLGGVTAGPDDGRGPVSEWIANQVSYFHRNAHRQHRQSLRAEHAYGVALAASALSSLALAITLWWLEPQPGELTGIATPCREALGTALLLLGLLATWVTRSGTRSEHGPSGWLVLLRGLLVACLVLIGSAFIAPYLMHWRDEEQTDYAAYRAVALTASVILLATAGMAKFYTEKRNHSAQAAHYDDMLRAFLRAQDWLAGTHGPFSRGELEMIKEMGELALDESEAWLKAHRDRPTRPIAPGG